MSDAVIGTEVDGYRIQAVLGRGGMGTVYRAEDVNLSRTVAIKRINPGQQEREAFIHRFRSEAQALARIDSTHIVAVHALRETDIGLLIVMEYVEGGTLKDAIDQQGALVPAQAVPILEQTLKAFDDAHSAGVIHRDIKPENVMLTQDGIVKVTDFGIAKLRQPDSGETVTQGGQGGTLKYMSPEQISSIDDVDARSDIYSLGMTAYEMLAGDLPFTETDTDFDIMRKVVEGQIPPPDDLNSDIPSGLAQWVVGAIQKEQDDRYQSVEEMKTALYEADRQSGDQTVTQPDWEREGGADDVDETKTVVPGGEDRTRTAIPGSDPVDQPDGDSADADSESGEETVMNPDTTPGGDDTTQPAVPEPEVADGTEADPAVSESFPSQDEEREEEGTNWLLLGGGGIALLLLLVGGYIAFTQLGRGGGSATLTLTTVQEGATVLVNGDTAGTTPINGYVMDAGAVQLQVEKQGYTPLDTAFTASVGGRVSLQNVALTEAESDGSTQSGETLADNSQDSSSGDSAPASEDGADQESSDSAVEQPPTTSGAEESTGSAREGDAASDANVTDRGADGADAATGIVKVTPEPSGTVLVDGEEQGGGGAITVVEGARTITCRHPRYGSVETTATVSAGETKALTCYFARSVTVTAPEVYGRIWVDGANTGEDTPATLSLGPGTHRIEVRRQSIDDFQVRGGIFKVERGGESETGQFSGDAYEVNVQPSFTEVQYTVSFKTAK